MKSLKKVRGKKISQHHWRTKKQILVGMKARVTRCKIFIISVQWDTNLHIMDYQLQKEVLSILNCLYLIEKNLAKNKIVSIINAQSMLSQNVERQRVNSTLQWLKTTS